MTWLSDGLKIIGQLNHYESLLIQEPNEESHKVNTIF